MCTLRLVCYSLCMSRYYNIKKMRRINQKLAKKRQHSYIKIADFFLDNPKYRWMLSSDTPVFLTELEPVTIVSFELRDEPQFSFRVETVMQAERAAQLTHTQMSL